MDKFDRILHRDDVLVPLTIDLVDHRRQRRRFARTGLPGHKHKARFLCQHLVYRRWQTERIDMRHFGHNDAKHHRVAMQHFVAVGTEALATKLDREINVTALVKGLEPFIAKLAAKQILQQFVGGHEVQRCDFARFPNMNGPFAMHMEIGNLAGLERVDQHVIDWIFCRHRVTSLFLPTGRPHAHTGQLRSIVDPPYSAANGCYQKVNRVHIINGN